jgi:hypothetical protein
MELIMKRITLATTIALLASTGAYAQGTNAEALEIARAQEACGDDLNSLILSARFLEDGRVGVRCAAGAVIPGGGAGAGAGGAVATNFVPALGGLFVAVLGAAAVGGASSTSDTR